MEKIFKKKGIHVILLFVGCLVFLFEGRAQIDRNRKLIQFSGMVVSGDSLSKVPFTSIIIKGTYHGTISDFYGFFSFVAQESDTIEFSSIGYKNTSFIIPDSLSNNRYSLIQVMRKDTIELPEAVIYPWPTIEQFKDAFLSLKAPDNDFERAMKNLEKQTILAQMQTVSMDANMNHSYYMQQYQSKLYYSGQLPPNNLLNPIAWAKFIQAWKNGDLKIKGQ